MHVTVYSTPVCPYCVKAKEFLKEHHISYKEVNVLADQKAAQALIEKTGQTGVPQIEIKNGKTTTMIIGFDKPALKKALSL